MFFFNCVHTHESIKYLYQGKIGPKRQFEGNELVKTSGDSDRNANNMYYSKQPIWPVRVMVIPSSYLKSVSIDNIAS